MLETCITCLSHDNLVDLCETEWKVLEYVVSSFKNYPELESNTNARLCADCQGILQIVESFRSSAENNFVQAMCMSDVGNKSSPFIAQTSTQKKGTCPTCLKHDNIVDLCQMECQMLEQLVSSYKNHPEIKSCTNPRLCIDCKEKLQYVDSFRVKAENNLMQLIDIWDEINTKLVKALKHEIIELKVEEELFEAEEETIIRIPDQVKIEETNKVSETIETTAVLPTETVLIKSEIIDPGYDDESNETISSDDDESPLKSAQPGLEPPQPGFKQPEPGLKRSQPSLKRPQRRSKRPQPVSKRPQPDLTRPQPGWKWPQPDLTRPQPGWKWPVSGLKTYQRSSKATKPALKPWRFSSDIEEPDSNAQLTMSPVFLSQTGLKLSELGLKLTEPGLKPPEPGLKPPQPGLEPLEPGLKPPELSEKPPGPDLKPPDSGLKPPELSEKPPEPSLKPPEPSLKPPEPSLKPPGPSLKPPEPSLKPPEPSLKRPQRRSKRPQRGSKRPQPDLKRLQPDLKRLQPGLKPPELSVKPKKTGLKQPKPETHQKSMELMKQSGMTSVQSCSIAKDKKHICVYCNQIFSYAKAVQTHMTKWHGDGSTGSQTCKTCNKTVKDTKSLKQHMRTHKRNVYCELCDKWYTNRDYQIHLKISLNHNKKEDLDANKIQCSDCSKTFTCQIYLKRHMRYMHNDKKVFCGVCDKWFRPKSYKEHLKTSSNHASGEEKRFTCDYCNMKFLRYCQMKQHITSKHLKLNLFKCVECGREYRNKSALTRHVKRIHEGQPAPRNHVCELCGRTFPDSQQLRRHMPVHTGERPYKCDKCEVTFGHSSQLYVHQKKCPLDGSRTKTSQLLVGHPQI